MTTAAPSLPLPSLPRATAGPAGQVPPGPDRRWPGQLRRLLTCPATWYAGFAVYAAAVALFSGPGLDHYWGIWASGAYAAAAALSWRWPGRRGRAVALTVTLAGALAGPLAWLAICAPATPDTAVVSRAGLLLLHHGTPYLGAAQLAHGGFLAYNPYLPVMAVFGLPHALGWPGLAGDPRPWLAIVTVVLLAAAFRVAGRSRPAAWQAAGFLIASPVLAFSIALGITDAPIIALIILALALARARAGWPAAVVIGPVVIGTACAMKYTAWPALAVLVAMIATRDGARAAARFAAMSVATAAALAAALAPAAFTSAAGLVALAANTVGYPLGLTHTRSPAQSPLPGHLLATLGPAGHDAALALLIAAGLAIAVSLVVRPPATITAAAGRIAIGLTLLFALCPATRFGYLDYPLALCGWLILSVAADLRWPRQTRHVPLSAGLLTVSTIAALLAGRLHATLHPADRHCAAASGRGGQLRLIGRRAG